MRLDSLSVKINLFRDERCERGEERFSAHDALVGQGRAFNILNISTHDLSDSASLLDDRAAGNLNCRVCY
jgi:hypothetical protein